MSFLVVAFLFLATSVFAEITVQNDQITADLTAQPLRQVVESLKQQSSVTIVLDDHVANTPVSAKFENVPLATGIRKMLEGTGVNFAVISDGEGNPERILISGSEKPGAPPRKLDTRPVTPPSRGVVTPIMPVAPPPTPPLVQQPAVQPQNKQPAVQPQNKQPAVQPQNKPGMGPNNPPNVPTAGSALQNNNAQNPSQPKPQQPQPNVNPGQQIQQVDPDDEDDEDDEDYDN